MKKFSVEVGIIENGAIISWDSDTIQDYIFAADAEEAMDFARSFIRKCTINNSYEPDVDDIVLRAHEVIDAGCDDYGKWVISIFSPRIKPNIYARPSIYKMLTLMFNDDVANADDFEAVRAAHQEYENDETVNHNAINWD